MDGLPFFAVVRVPRTTQRNGINGMSGMSFVGHKQRHKEKFSFSDSLHKLKIPDSKLKHFRLKMLNFKGLDHLAIAVKDTEESLKTWRDKLGFAVLYAEKVNNDTVLLTHLDLGNTQLQLVEPLVADSPLAKAVNEKGDHLHHFCLLVDDVAVSKNELDGENIKTAPNIHQGTKGKRALFIDKSGTDNVQVEITGK